MRQVFVLSTAILVAFVSAAIAQQPVKVEPAVVDAYIKGTFKSASRTFEAAGVASCLARKTNLPSEARYPLAE